MLFPGFSYLTEYISPSRPRSYRVYSCSLEGCKSAWGTSNDMFHHLLGKNTKHHRNFLANHCHETAAMGLTKNEVARRVLQRVEEDPGAMDADIRNMRVVQDERKYEELRDRPTGWSEDKARTGARIENFKRPSGRDEHDDRSATKRSRVEEDAAGKVAGEEMIEELDKLRRCIERSARDMERGRKGAGVLKPLTGKALECYQLCLGGFGRSANMPHVEENYRNLQEHLPKLEDKVKSAFDRNTVAFRELRDRAKAFEKQLAALEGGREDKKGAVLDESLAALAREVEAFEPDSDLLGQFRDELKEDVAGLRASLKVKLEASPPKTAEREMTREERISLAQSSPA